MSDAKPNQQITLVSYDAETDSCIHTVEDMTDGAYFDPVGDMMTGEEIFQMLLRVCNPKIFLDLYVEIDKRYFGDEEFYAELAKAREGYDPAEIERNNKKNRPWGRKAAETHTGNGD